ncbi:MAG TPA: class I adenylate-forming enzyme family protein [Sphingomonas sp.]
MDIADPTLIDLIARAAEAYPDHEAVVDEISRYTYAELIDLALRMGGMLRDRGVRPGDRVALLSPTCAHHAIAVLGVMGMGAIPCSLHVRESVETLAGVIESIAPRLLIFDGLYEREARALLDGSASLTGLVRLSSPLTPAQARASTGGEPLIPDDLAAFDPEPGFAPVEADDVAAIVLSSGTTGLPKGIVHSHRTLAASARNGMLYMVADDQARGLNIFSTAFIGWYNCTFPFLCAGGRVVYRARWEPLDYLRAIETEGITACILVPTMWRMLLKHAGRTDFGSLRRVGYVGEKIDLDTLRTIQSTVCAEVMNSYGATETGTWAGCTVMLPEDYRATGKLDSIGRAARGVEVRIVEPGGPVDRLLPPGQEGELVISGPSVASRIWGQPEVTRKKFDGKWWRSGDLGLMDADGYIYLKGRSDDMIITGGINVLPNVIEDAIRAHPAVAECVVLGMPCDQWGQKVTAFVQSRQALSEEELRGFVDRSGLAGYQKPRAYHFVDDIPRGNTGKISRKQLMEQMRPLA